MPDCRASALKAQLKKTREEKLKEAGHDRSDVYEPTFFPHDAINIVLCWNNVNSILACQCNRCVRVAAFAPRQMGSKERAQYASFVTKDALRLFALLVYVELSALISAFEPKGDRILDDEDLNKESLKLYLANNNSTELDNDLEAFLNHRHKFFPVLFHSNWYEKWDSRKVLPFINTRFVGDGSYGTVYSFEIYPGYGNLSCPGLVGIHISRVTRSLLN